MANKYGPWATLIDIGGNPQLSAFWRRRLAMLVPASRTSPVLSRRNLLLLAAAGILTCVLPTLFFVPAMAEEKRPAQENGIFMKTGVYSMTLMSDRSEEPKSTAGAQGDKASQTTMGFVTISGMEDKDYIFIPVYIFCNLSSEATRKRLNITDEQEKKLREISGNYYNLLKSGLEVRKEMEKLSAQEQAAKQRQYQARLNEARKNIRKQVEDLLSPEQLGAMRREEVGLMAGRVVTDGKLQEKIGISPEQKKQLSLLPNSAEQKAGYDRLERLMKENHDKTLAVITPQQWDEMDRMAGESNSGNYSFTVSGMSASGYPGMEIDELQFPEVSKKLDISAEQQTKLQDVIAQSGRQSMELVQLSKQSQNVHPTKQQQAKQSEMWQKIQEFSKRDHERIVAALTPRQLSEFRKLCIKEAFLRSLSMSEIVGRDIDGKDQQGILNRIKASPEQISELRRLNDEISNLRRQNNSESAQKVLEILSPQQQEEIVEILDNPSDTQDSGETK